MWPALSPGTPVRFTESDRRGHSCKDASPFSDGDGLPASEGDQHGKGKGKERGILTPPPSPLDTVCSSCGHHRGGPTALHKLRCGHYLCHLCLQKKAATTMTGRQFVEEAKDVGRRIHGPREQGYAESWEGKVEIMMGLWERLGWACCGLPIPFNKYMDQKCIPDATSLRHLELWDKAIHIIETVGGRIILNALDPFMEIKVEGDEEVAVVRVQGKKGVDGLEKLEGIKYINPFERTVENPSGWQSHVPSLRAKAYARAKKEAALLEAGIVT